MKLYWTFIIGGLILAICIYNGWKIKGNKSSCLV